MVDLKFALVKERGGHRAAVKIDRIAFETPPIEHAAFYIGLGVLAAAEVIEWPLAALLMAGHVLLDATNRPALHELGEALGEA